jgi:hypothetical protein
VDRFDLMTRPPRTTYGADITDNDHNAAAVARQLFSESPAHEPIQQRAILDDSPAAMRLLRTPFAAEPADSPRTADSQPDKP